MVDITYLSLLLLLSFEAQSIPGSKDGGQIWYYNFTWESICTIHSLTFKKEMYLNRPCDKL